MNYDNDFWGIPDPCIFNKQHINFVIATNLYVLSVHGVYAWYPIYATNTFSAIFVRRKFSNSLSLSLYKYTRLYYKVRMHALTFQVEVVRLCVCLCYISLSVWIGVSMCGAHFSHNNDLIYIFINKTRTWAYNQTINDSHRSKQPYSNSNSKIKSFWLNSNNQCLHLINSNHR